MLMVSDQDMLRAGNQVLYETVHGYVAAGYRVIFVTNRKDDPNVATAEELFGKEASSVEIHRFRVGFHIWRQRLIGRGWLKRFQRLRKALTLKGPTKEEPPYPPVPEAVLPFAAGFGDVPEFLNRFGTKLFERYAYKTCMKVARRYPIHLVYSFETGAIHVARKVATHLGVPLCTRFQGSFLKHALDEGTAKKLYPLHLKSTAIEADLCIMSNDGTKGDKVLLQLGHPPERILFLLDGVRKDFYKPEVERAAVWAGYGIPNHAKTILTLSKLSPWKRLDRVIGTMPAILQEVPDAYLVVGHRGAMRSLLEQYAKDLGVAHRVVFTGPMPHTHVYSLLNSCDIYVNCNDHSNLSLTVQEALVCGKPVVSIDDGSLEGIITHGQNGVLVSLPRIRDELPDQIISLLKDDARRTEMSRNARRFAEANLRTWEERMAVEVSRVEQLLRQQVAV